MGWIKGISMVLVWPCGLNQMVGMVLVWPSGLDQRVGMVPVWPCGLGHYKIRSLLVPHRLLVYFKSGNCIVLSRKQKARLAHPYLRPSAIGQALRLPRVENMD